MKRTEPIAVGELLNEYIANRALGPASMEGRAVELWADVVGEHVASYTEDVYIRSGVIYVNFSSAAVRAEMFMRRREVVAAINSALRSRIVLRIVIR